MDEILTVLASSDEVTKVGNLSSLFEAMHSPSLFGGDPVIYFDETEKLSKQEQQALGRFLEQPINSGYLILGARSKTIFMSGAEKQGVVVDLLEEKPWEKEKRLAEQIGERVERAGKKLSSDVAPLLLERIGSDAPLLDQEIDKLLSFVGERLNIERSDVFRITGASRLQTIWQIADEMIWEKAEVAVAGDLFHSLVPLLRSQLQLGLKLASFVETKLPRDQWDQYLPKIWPKTLEKRTAQATKKGSGWFRRSLDLLFELELLSRDGSTQTAALLDLFRIRTLDYTI